MQEAIKGYRDSAYLVFLIAHTSFSIVKQNMGALLLKCNLSNIYKSIDQGVCSMYASKSKINDYDAEMHCIVPALQEIYQFRH